MKKILLVDISGKVTSYDLSLYEAICEQTVDSVSLLYPGHGLMKLIPEKFHGSTNIAKRIVKVFEGLINYLCLSVFLLFKKVDVLHLEWLPFEEFVGWENNILAFMKVISRRTKFILTIHNVYPHDMSDVERIKYNSRFKNVSKKFDSFIVHTQNTKEAVCKEFGMLNDDVTVIHHGVFEPKGIENIKRSRKDEKIRFISYGIQSKYKGTDILVEAASLLPDDYKNRMELSIVGSIQKDFYDKLISKATGLTINWKPFFVDEYTLYQEIVDADVIVLPYRAISQSGVLLLALCFGRPIITSDLPSFRETLEGCSEDEFFKSEEPKELCKLMMKYIDDTINRNEMVSHIELLRKKYSWETAANKTLEVYFA